MAKQKQPGHGEEFEEKFLTLYQIAKRQNRHFRTVQRDIARFGITAYRFGRRTTRYKLSDILKMEQQAADQVFLSEFPKAKPKGDNLR
jgi:hypothetical protein